MLIHSHQPKSNIEARQRIESALNLLGTARGENSSLTDVFEAASEKLEGHEPHVKSIEFDRRTRDVSQHGVQLRTQAQDANQDIQTGVPASQSLESHAEDVADLISEAIVELGSGNGTARRRLDSAQRNLEFARESSIPVPGMNLEFAGRILTDSLDPYLTEVEEDSPGRDVGRFADNIDEMWRSAEARMSSGPIYIDSTERSFLKIRADLESARDSL